MAHAIFEFAADIGNAVLVLDECEGLFAKRSDETSSAPARSMKAAMLSNMQKPRDSKWPLFTVALSNLPWDLDEVKTSLVPHYKCLLVVLI